MAVTSRFGTSTAASMTGTTAGSNCARASPIRSSGPVARHTTTPPMGEANSSSQTSAGSTTSTEKSGRRARRPAAARAAAPPRPGPVHDARRSAAGAGGGMAPRASRSRASRSVRGRATRDARLGRADGGSRARSLRGRSRATVPGRPTGCWTAGCWPRPGAGPSPPADRRRRVRGELEPLREEATPGIRVVGVVADRRAAEGPVDHVGDVDAADQPVATLRVMRPDHEGPIRGRLRGEDHREVGRVGDSEVGEAPSGPRHRFDVCRDVGFRGRPHLHRVPHCRNGGPPSQRTTRPLRTTPIGLATTDRSARGSDRRRQGPRPRPQ